MHEREFHDGDLVPGTRYRVVGLLGAGGMGTVYEVEHVALGKRFVLKVLSRELECRPDLVRRMRNEWRALGRLDHPNIVNVTDAGTTATGVPFFVMERLEGETLAARLVRERRLAPTEALEVMAGVVEGLGAAHAIGVVHRDVKPPNIFLVQGRAPKLLDFGVAKSTGLVSVVTARGVAVGTPRYMAPEQVRGQGVDGRTDLYACGLVLFEMLTGFGPYDDARDANELLLAHATRPPPKLSELGRGVPEELDRLVLELLEKDPRRRPRNAAVVALRLRELVRTARQRSTGEQPLELFIEDEPTTDVAVHRAPSGATTQLVRLAGGRTLTTVPVRAFTHTTLDPLGATTQVPVRSKERLPTVTVVEPLSEKITEAAPVAERASVSATSRTETIEPIGLAEGAADPGETRTQVPLPAALENSAPAEPEAAPALRTGRRRGVLMALGALVITISSAGLVWKLSAPYAKAGSAPIVHALRLPEGPTLVPEALSAPTFAPKAPSVPQVPTAASSALLLASSPVAPLASSAAPVPLSPVAPPAPSAAPRASSTGSPLVPAKGAPAAPATAGRRALAAELAAPPRTSRSPASSTITVSKSSARTAPSATPAPSGAGARAKKAGFWLPASGL